MSWSSHRVRPQPASARPSRAYCGGAHGSSWVLAGEADPPVTVGVPSPDGQTSYRLVHSPRAGRPVKGSQGNYLYLPASGGLQMPADAKVVR